MYRSLVPSLPYLIIVFCYSRILVTFRRVQHRVDKHRASVTSQSKVRSIIMFRRLLASMVNLSWRCMIFHDKSIQFKEETSFILENEWWYRQFHV